MIPFQSATDASERTHRARSARERYGIAVLAAAIGVSGDLLLSTVLNGTPLYAVLVGAVVLSVAYGGLGPGILTLALAWAGALWLLEPPRGELTIEDGSEWVRWGVALSIAAFLLAFMLLLRRERERATTAVEAAEDAIRDTSALQDLAAA